MSEEPPDPSTDPDGLAPLGGPAEAEPPVHTADLTTGLHGPDPGSDAPLEDSTAYGLAVEDGAPLPASGDDPGAGPLAPRFQRPGAS